MFLYFDKRGTLKEVIDGLPARVGSGERNKVYAYFETEGVGAVSFKSDGTGSVEAFVNVTTPITLVDNESATGFYIGNVDLKYFKLYKQYNFYVYTLTNADLTAGLRKMTVRAFEDIDDEEETATILAGGMLIYKVEENVVQADDSIGQNEFDYLIAKLALTATKSYVDEELGKKFDKNKVVTAFGETTSDEKVASEKLVKDNLDLKLDKVSTATTYKQAYVKDINGTQTMSDLKSAVSNNDIVVRDNGGQIKVGTALSNDDAIGKGQVDVIANAKQETITDLVLPYGEHTITYDLTDGLGVNGKVKFNNNANVNLDYYLPIKSGVGLTMDADDTNKWLVVKLIKASDTNLGGVIVDNSTIKINENGVISATLNSYNFKGFISTNEPTSDIRAGNLWYNSNALPTTFPIQVKTYDGSSWSETTTAYTPHALDLWSFITGNKSYGYYYFGNEWNRIDADIEVDNSTITKNLSGQVQVADNGVSWSKLAVALQTKINEKATMKFSATEPADLQNGEYWANEDEEESILPIDLVDNTSIGYNLNDELEVKNGGITTAKLHADLQATINGKQNAITETNKLSSDLVDDTDATNKFVNATEKETWNSKQSAIDSSNKLNADYVDDTNSTKKFITSEQATSIANNTTEIATINGKISTQATATNKLMSATEVDEKIASLEAKQVYATNSQGSFATKSALTSATTFYDASGNEITLTKNDVAYVLADETHDGKLAKYVVASVSPVVWGFVISISETSFTQQQLDAINSGVNSTKVATYDGYASGKQDALSQAQLDACNSGITSALVSTFTAKQNAITYGTATPTGGSDGDIYIQLES